MRRAPVNVQINEDTTSSKQRRLVVVVVAFMVRVQEQQAVTDTCRLEELSTDVYTLIEISFCEKANSGPRKRVVPLDTDFSLALIIT